jgi:hypothetical protein
MSSLRIIAGSRPTDPRRESGATRTDNQTEGASFPDALQSATNTAETPASSKNQSDAESEGPLPEVGPEPGDHHLTSAPGARREASGDAPERTSRGDRRVAVDNPAPIATPDKASSGQLGARSHRPWRGWDTNASDILPAEIGDDDSRRHPVRRSDQQTGASDAAVAVAILPNTAAQEARQLTYGPSIDGQSNAPAVVSPAAEGARSLDSPSAGRRWGALPTSYAEPDSGISAFPTQDSAPDDAAGFAATHSTSAPPGADDKDSVLGKGSAVGPASLDSLGTAPSPETTKRAIEMVASAASDAVTAEPYLSPERNVEGSHSSSSIQVAGTPNPVASNNELAGSPVEGSTRASESNPSPAGLAEQLAHHVIRSVENGGREVVLQLHPPELGELTVRVLVNGRDVSAWFGSPQIPVQQAINQAIGQLHADLGNAGYNLNGAWVGADASDLRDWARGLLVPSTRGSTNRPRSEGPPVSASLPAASGVSIYV